MLGLRGVEERMESSNDSERKGRSLADFCGWCTASGVKTLVHLVKNRRGCEN